MTDESTSPTETSDRALKLRDRIDQLMDERHFPAHLYDTCEELKEIAAELSDLPPISLDGPNLPDEHRVWLARQLLDSKLTDAEAYGIVRHSPAVKPPALEDAQPVAWKFRHVGQRMVGVTMYIKEAELKAASGWEVEPLGLITRPAPDALLAVAEALGKTPAIEALTPTNQEWIECVSVQDRYDLMKRCLRQALATLQPEQGASND